MCNITDPLLGPRDGTILTVQLFNIETWHLHQTFKIRVELQHVWLNTRKNPPEKLQSAGQGLSLGISRSTIACQGARNAHDIIDL